MVVPVPSHDRRFFSGGDLAGSGHETSALHTHGRTHAHDRTRGRQRREKKMATPRRIRMGRVVSPTDQQQRSEQISERSSKDEVSKKGLMCSVCLERLKDPRLLPCLHTYCKGGNYESRNGMERGTERGTGVRCGPRA